jgi:hypothetical protein
MIESATSLYEPDSTKIEARPSPRRSQAGRSEAFSIDHASFRQAQRLFTAAQAKNVEKIMRCYAPDAVLLNQLAGRLTGDDIRKAWEALFREALEFDLQYRVETAGFDGAIVAWTLRCTSSRSLRRFCLPGTTLLTFAAAGLERQVDRCDYSAWSRQAFGFGGRILIWLPGWGNWVRDSIRQGIGAPVADRRIGSANVVAHQRD